MRRYGLLVSVLMALPASLSGQGRFPPDSLVNTRVIPHGTPVIQVIGTMRNFTSALGVRCPFCHVGVEGQPLEQFDFPNDEKRPKLVARQMMRMVEEINRRLDTIPGRETPGLQVTCSTCHHGANRPMPLSQLMTDMAQLAGADSAIRAYGVLRARYFGRDTYDFTEPTLNIAAFRLARAGRFDDAMALLRFNEEQYPNSSAMYVFRGNINLMRADTTAAADAFREAVRRDSANNEAMGRLRDIHRTP